tara:strand:- start:26016 stop:26198 length:183 start_codon:yes stop_codon:yes gene_type:complete
MKTLYYGYGKSCLKYGGAQQSPISWETLFIDMGATTSIPKRFIEYPMIFDKCVFWALSLS